MGPEPKERGRQAYFPRLPPSGHIGQLAQSGKSLGKNRMFWPFGPRCGPKGLVVVPPPSRTTPGNFEPGPSGLVGQLVILNLFKNVPDAPILSSCRAARPRPPAPTARRV